MRQIFENLSRQSVVGLDMGQARIKAVVLDRKGGNVRLTDAQLLDCQAEGILSAAEMYPALTSWMREQNWLQKEIVVGIPQDLATTQVADFPPGTDDRLDELVAYETQHLAGLSEQSFLHDYSLLSSDEEGKHRALIGMCRESVATERESELAEAGLTVADLSMNGLALANAYLSLYPDAAEVEGPQLLLDLGHGTSTMVVLVGRDVYYCGGLMSGAERYAEALAEDRGISVDEAEKAKFGLELDMNDRESTAYQVTQILEGEIEAALDQWRTQEQSDLAHKMFGRFCLSGGGANIGGLADYFGRSFGCPAQVIGVPAGQGNSDSDHSANASAQPDPSYMIAYGLALQGAGSAPVSISLASPKTRWRTVRRHRFGYLAGATAMIAVAVALLFSFLFVQLGEKKTQLNDRLGQLNKCNKIIPRLDSVNNDIHGLEQTLVPFVAKGNRAWRYLESLEKLGNARAEGSWFVYVADRATFRRGQASIFRPSGKGGSGDKKKRGGLFGGGSATEADIGAGSMRSPFPIQRKVTEVPLLEGLVAGGYVPFRGAGGLAPVRKIVKNLDSAKAAESRKAFFKNVDSLPPNEWKGRKEIYGPWVKLLSGRQTERYKFFMLKVPFASLDIKTSAAKEESGESG